MHTRTLAKSFPLPTIASLALILLLGCEEEPPQKPVIDANKAENTPGIETEKNSGEDPNQEIQPVVSAENLETGQYRLQVSDGKISLNSAWSSRIVILEDLSRKIGFELKYTGDSDSLVVVNQTMSSMAALLEILLEGVNYAAEYKAKPGDNGFRIASLNIGSSHTEDEATGAKIYTQPAIDLAVVFPESSGEIFLGPDADDTDLATRLQSGTIEDQAIAVSELNLDSAGLNAAYQVYTRTTSPAVRIAVLELIESEDNYLARSMVVLSLQSLDPAEAMAALSIVDSVNDYSLAPQVQALLSHHDTAVRELAEEVLESMASDDDRLGEADATTVIFDTHDSRRIEPGLSGDRK